MKRLKREPLRLGHSSPQDRCSGVLQQDAAKTFNSCLQKKPFLFLFLKCEKQNISPELCALCAGDEVFGGLSLQPGKGSSGKGCILLHCYFFLKHFFQCKNTKALVKSGVSISEWRRIREGMMEESDASAGLK